MNRCWIDLCNMSAEQVKELSEEQQMDWINLLTRQSRREDTICSRLPLFIYKVKKMYEISTGLSFEELWNMEECAKDGRLVMRALKAVRESGRYEENADEIDFSRDVVDWTLADLELIDSCLKYSLRYEFLLIRYNEQAMWANKKFDGMDVWEVYKGIFKECRSPVLNLFTMDYVLLPYAKFRNLGESPEYSEENVLKKISESKVVEVSDKLDGSMIQISNIHDERFWNGCIVATSGSLYPSKSSQLKDVLDYLKVHEEIASFMNHEFDENTYIFEWIDENDLHIVRYDKEKYGLHLIGRRSHKSGFLWTVSHVIELAKKYGIQTTEIYDMRLEDILSQRGKYKSFEKEGFVLYADGFQVKIKCGDYIGIARLIQTVGSFNTIVKAVADNRIDDLISILPESYKDMVNEMVCRICNFESNMLTHIEREFKRLPLNAERKEVMLFIENEINDPYGLLKNLVRAKYLGKPIEILSQKKGDSVHYIMEKNVKQYEEWFRVVETSEGDNK